MEINTNSKEYRKEYRRICKDAHGDFPWHYHVHHIDRNRLNNAPENLIALHPQLHSKIHSKQFVTIPCREQIEKMLDSYQSEKDRYISLITESNQLRKRISAIRAEIRSMRYLKIIG